MLKENIERNEMKSTATYKMCKDIKIGLALGKFHSMEDRAAWKQAAIGAELAALYTPKKMKFDSRVSNDQTEQVT